MTEHGVTLPILLLICGVLAFLSLFAGQYAAAFILGLVCAAGFRAISRENGKR